MQTWPGNPWRNDVLLKIQHRVPGRANDLYTSPESLDHFDRVASRLLAITGDVHLARAGFLHGLPLDHLQSLKPLADADRTIAVLKSWLSLRHVIGGKETTPESLRDFLKNLEDPRGAVLATYALMEAADPHGLLGAWTRAFRHAPVPLPPGVPRKAPDCDPDDMGFDACDAAARWVPVLGEWTGLWDARNTAENLRLLCGDPAGFGALVDTCVSLHDGREIAALVDHVRAVLPGTAPRWEWRHVTSIQEHRSDASATHLVQMGFVTVPYGDAHECYLALGDLHAVYPHEFHSLRDFIGRDRASVYPALHTVLRVPVPESSVQQVPVRLVVRPPTQDPTLEEAPQLDRLWERAGGTRGGRIRVYTPAREVRLLPTGARVLNFIRAVSSALVGHVRHATLKGREDPVDLLHPLADGDVVTLHRSETFLPLPPTWEAAVPPQTIPGIREAIRHSERRGLRSAGLDRVRHALARYLEDDFSEEALVGLVERAGLALFRRGVGRSRTPDEWLHDLGVVQRYREGTGRGSETPPPCTGEVKLLLDALVRDVVAQSVDRLALVLPPEVEATVTRRRWCDTCVPDAGDTLCATVDGDTLVLHRKTQASPCGGQTEAVSVGYRSRQVLPAYFVTEITNRVGITAESLQVFRDLGVNLAEVNAVRMGRWGVQRFMAESQGFAMERRIAQGLACVNGTMQVWGPRDPVPTHLEADLPPRRRLNRPSQARVPRYCLGRPVEDDHHFYGRETLIGDLIRLFDGAMEKWNPADGQRPTTCAAQAFVTGPLKSGKTSLCRKVVRDIRKSRQGRVICVEVEARPVGPRDPVGPLDRCETWNDLRPRLVQALLDGWNAWASAQPTPGDLPRPADLPDLVATCRSLPDPPAWVVLLDEAVGMLRETELHPTEWATCNADRNLLSDLPRAMIAWIGPQAPVTKFRSKWGKHQFAGMPSFVVGPFETWTLVHDLLQGEKLPGRDRIQVQVSLARRVFEVTGGEPFWINYLARELGEAARLREQHLLSADLLDDALSQVLQTPAIFGTRTMGDGHWRSNRVEFRILQAMAWEAGRRADDTTPFDHAELRDLARHTLGRITEERLSLAVRQLDEAGSLRAVQDRYRARRIAAPLLARYLRDCCTRENP